MSYDPTVGRWLQQDPEAFDAGDPNDYRYVGNDPTNATDPSGEIVLFQDRAGAEAFKKELEQYGATHVQIIEGKGQFAVITDRRDQAAIFMYADRHFPKTLNPPRSFTYDTALPDVKDEAERRAKFLAAMLSNPTQTFSQADGNDPATNSIDAGLMGASLAELKTRNAQINEPLVVDVGGEGPATNNRINFNVKGTGGSSGVGTAGPIPRLIPRVPADAPLPYPDNSVDQVYMMGLPAGVAEGTAADAGRALKPGGQLIISTGDANNAYASHLAVIATLRAKYGANNVSVTTTRKDFTITSTITVNK